MDGDDRTTAFELVGDPTRAAILQELAASGRDDGDPAVEFSELRRRVGRRDSGNFNYHLSKLVGRFVERTESGYRLTPQGVHATSALAAGRFEDHDPRGPEPVGTCRACGETLTATYESTVLTVRCDGGHEWRNALPPASVESESLEDAVAAMVAKTGRDLELARRGRCPNCRGEISLEPTDRGRTPFAARCGTCGTAVSFPAGACLHTHPAVVGFYHERGVDLREAPARRLALWSGEATTRVSADPAAFEVRAECDGDALVVTVDEAPSVAGVRRA